MAKKTATNDLKNKIIKQLPSLENKRVMIIGDIGLDEYVMGQVRRISPEAPVPVLDVEAEDSRLGLSGNVAQNISSLGGYPILISVVGQDSGAESLRQLLKLNKVESDFLVVDQNRPTTRKTRIMAQHHHLVRVDYELRHFLDEVVATKVIAQVQNAMEQTDIVILQDYAKGVIGRKIIENVIQIAHSKNKKVLMDPHRTNPASIYEGVDLIKPNFDESLSLVGMTYEDFKLHKKSIKEVGELLRAKVKSEYVILTQGKEGMSIFSNNEEIQVPTYARQVFDVTGAGDTVIAAISLGMAAGWSIEESCVLANFAAGVVVGKVGCVPCGITELQDYIHSFDE